MKNKYINLLSIITCSLFLISCDKSEYEIEPRHKEDIYLNILEDTVEFIYPTGYSSSYVFIDYESDSLQRVYWTSPDSFTSIVYGWRELNSIADMSTYTKSDRTGRQGVYISNEFIGKTLKVIAFTNETTKNNARDSVFIKVL